MHDCFEFRNDYNSRSYSLDENSMMVVDSRQAFVEIHIATLYQQSRNGWTVSLHKVSVFKDALKSSRGDTRSLSFRASIRMRAPLGSSFVPSYFKARFHLMRVYANFNSARSYDRPGVWRNRKSTRVNKHRAIVARNQKKYKEGIIAIYLQSLQLKFLFTLQLFFSDLTIIKSRMWFHENDISQVKAICKRVVNICRHFS